MGAAKPPPAFTRQEQALIATWLREAPLADFRVEVTTEREMAGDLLRVIPVGEDDPLWLVHKTPDGAVGVRLWPGVAEIVPTVSDALAVITASLRGQREAGQA